METTYTYNMLVSDFAELCDKADSRVKTVQLTPQDQQGLVVLVATEFAPFLVGRYNMTFKNAEDIIATFVENIKSDPEGFANDVFKTLMTETLTIH